MKVIFLKHVPGRGEKGDVKEISDGYARNLLIPRGMAIPATLEALKKLTKEKLANEGKEAATIKRLTEMARDLESKKIEFRLKSDEHGSVFGSVNKDHILKALREHGLTSQDRVELVLDRPLKEFGEHKVEAHLHKGVNAKLKIVLAPEE